MLGLNFRVMNVNDAGMFEILSDPKVSNGGVVQWVHHDGSIQEPITSWVDALPQSYILPHVHQRSHPELYKQSKYIDATFWIRAIHYSVFISWMEKIAKLINFFSQVSHKQLSNSLDGLFCHAVWAWYLLFKICIICNAVININSHCVLNSFALSVSYSFKK